jgi:biotin carboxyl carrier protein
MAAAEIFISYKSQRRNAAEHFADVLQRNGYSVWFDYELIKGHEFGPQIDLKIREAKAVVVLWCSLSVESRWVAEEADLAYELGILIPVKIEPCPLPVGFRRQDCIDLTAWNGDPRSHLLDPLIEALEKRVDRQVQINHRALRDYANIWRRFGSPSLKDFARLPLDSVERDRHLPVPGQAAPSWTRTASQPTVEARPPSMRDEKQNESSSTATKSVPPDQAVTRPANVVDVRVPMLGESVDEATVGRWLIKLGEVAAQDDPVLELETDKVTIEIPAPVSGALVQIFAKEGETVQVNALLGRFAKR